MHGAFETTSAMVSELRRPADAADNRAQLAVATHWFTGAAFGELADLEVEKRLFVSKASKRPSVLHSTHRMMISGTVGEERTTHDSMGSPVRGDKHSPTPGAYQTIPSGYLRSTASLIL